MSPARIYILLATYQGQTYLAELLRSIQTQSHADWTLLVRDDGSRDATRQILHDAAARDPRIVIAQDDGLQRGAVGTFSWLLQRAWHDRADYVLPADQDDIWQPDKVARQVEALQVAESSAGREVPRLVYCDAAVIDAARRPVHASFLRQNRLPYGSGRPLKTLLGRSFVLGCACAVNRPLMELALPLPKVVASHDWWLALCAVSAGKITCLDVPLLEYRRHAANASQAAFWNVFRGSDGGWKRRWEIGWRNFLRSLEQAKALRDRLHERNVVAGEEGELLEAFCRIVEQPVRLRRIRELHRLGVPAIDWPRRVLFDLCVLISSSPARSGT
ncbi:MAG: glycosyltransferase family 2 protein [Thermoguttaceae bacterium]